MSSANAAVDMFSPYKLRDVSFRNRIGMPPMLTYWAEDGMVNDSHVAHYGAHAMGGCGVIIVEVTAVSPLGRISLNDLGAWKDEQIAGLRRVADIIKKHGCVAGIQIGHAGRKGSVQTPLSGNRHASLNADAGAYGLLAPSAIPHADGAPTPKDATHADLTQVTAEFVAATRRAREAGYQVLEIHAAHGFLLNEFLSPLSNKRTDEYGGSFENRTRLLREVVSVVRKEWPASLPLFVRLSCVDHAEGGWGESDSIALSRVLKELGVDLIHCSSGGVVSYAKYSCFTAYQVPYADHIRAQAAEPTAAVGLLIKPEDAAAVISKGQADLVMIGREMLRDPFWAIHAARALKRPDAEKWPDSFVWCVGPGK